MEVINGNVIDDQNSNRDFGSQNVTNEISLRPRSTSAPQEPTLQSIANDTNTTASIANPSQQNDPQQRRFNIKCDCGLEPVLREVKINTPNKGRFFWSCSKFGRPDHMRRCNFFKWDSPNENENDVDEQSFLARNRNEIPYVLIRSVTPLISYNDNNNSNDDDDNSEVNLSPRPDQLSENNVVPRLITRTRATSAATPLLTPHRRRRNRRATSSQAPGSPPMRSQSSIAANNALTGDVYTRKPALFSNWDDVPKYSTPQLLDIMQNHLVQQDKNYQQWYTAYQLAKQDLEEAKKKIEKLNDEYEVVNRENELYKRENDILKAEKRLLEYENNELKEENQELKRRRF
ncbi:18080_t:CDS:2 [Funneliformis geosporum]|uniref:13984_t:CDS:1 n=1 Tax=Funneliformis geosporum TaxID=1117311 RepID=A0A9W4WXW2_9GLOM|nr:13984_t:CDS:2 [Funneliformis geosporum]CAI2178733.1 18080_t:CDS:2 [Funneliformis geosporum]